MELQNVKWDKTALHRMREDVLHTWPTGREVNLEEGIAYQLSMKKKRNFSRKLRTADQNNTTLAQPRAGVALVDQHIDLLQFLENEAEADLLPTTIDCYTRQNRYKEAQAGIDESVHSGRCMLNGFPAVNHGVSACKKIVEAVNIPVQVRHGTPDARLLAEITLAGGFSSFEGGGISYNIPYTKSVPLEKSIYWWQYVDRLTGYYQEMGADINREPFGPLTGTLVPPCISHAVGIIEALLAAEQGVKNITLGYGQCGNLIQDVAAIKTLKSLAKEYLGRHGFEDVEITTVLHQWMGGFPQDESKAFAVIAWGTTAAALSKATKVIVKTPHEAFGIPTKQANLAGIMTTKQIINMLRDQQLEDSHGLDGEKEIIIKETRAILDKTYELGQGDWAMGAVRAFKAGVIDVPFAPSTSNAGKILPVRDNNGAVRMLEIGNLPLTEEMKKFHRDTILQRGKAEGREPSFQMVIDDIYAIGKGMLVGKPKQ